jgi:hypothetical protein
MIFIDSNLPMYAAGADHPLKVASLRFLKAVEANRREACTSVEVFQEILHRYHAEQRTDFGIAVYTEFALICPDVLDLTQADTDRAVAILSAVRGISARDATHAAVMLNHGITEIATFDRGFDRIPGVRRLELA